MRHTHFDQATIWDLLTPTQAYALRQLDDRQYRATMACIESEIRDYNLSIEAAIDLVIGDCHD
jgi:hypothetical protein